MKTGLINIDRHKIPDFALHCEFCRFCCPVGHSTTEQNTVTSENTALIYDESRSVNPDISRNIIIEGENLNVLKLLNDSYREQVKCIYIDPPYNTGKKNVYSDSFKDGDWLNMMYSRLLIAKDLLRKDGVIFISIDDNEVAHLRLLCDEIFGKECFAGQIVWKTATDNNHTQIATEHEYVVCYVKDIDAQGFWEIPSEKGQIIQGKYDELKKVFGDDVESIQTTLRKWIKKQTGRVDLSEVAHYKYVDEQGVFYPGNSANTKPGGYTFDIIHPVTKKVCARPQNGYRFTFDTFSEATKREDVLWGKDERIIPKIKKRLDTVTQKLKSLYYEDNRTATAQLKALFGGVKVFNNPKSVKFLKYIFQFVTKEDDLILDFFAGSGSTGQAVFELMMEGKGVRNFILVQIPEKTDANSEAYKAGFKTISDITIERNKQVIEKITKQEIKPAQKDSLRSLGFKVFKQVNLDTGK